jgi:DNA-directed RNA polymerase specialized sigma24 family protein
MVAHAEGGRAEALTARLPHLYVLANALDANAADDLVRETLDSALVDPDIDTTGSGLAAALTRLAANVGPLSRPRPSRAPAVIPTPTRPSSSTPTSSSTAPMPAPGVDPPVAWGEARVLCPADDLVTTEAYGVVDAALAELDPIEVGLVTLVDIEGAGFSEPSLSSTCSPATRERIARARFAVRAARDRRIPTTGVWPLAPSLVRPELTPRRSRAPGKH